MTKNNILLRNFLIFLLVASVLASCKKDDVTPKEKNFNTLVDWQFISKVSKSTVLILASIYPDVYNILIQKDLLDVNVYRITYKTTNVEGNEIIASGAVIVPITSTAIPIFSYQHGSIFDKEEAPSNYTTGLETKGLATIIASAGYAVSVPDYLGYGESADYPHPYEHAKTLGLASYDMLLAAKEFFDYYDVALTEKLFLTGYSEGGNATMALHQHIEQNSSLVVTMSAPASGAYNKTAFARDIMQRDEELQFLPRFMWVIDAYNWVYDLNRPWNDFVVEPDATTLEAVTDPLQLGNATINLNPQLLFTTQLKDGVLNETDNDFLNTLADNDNYDWTPNYPITLYYGTADDYVFPLNSETAYDAFKSNGANVTKVVYEGKDHSTAFIPYLLDMFELFESLK